MATTELVADRFDMLNHFETVQDHFAKLKIFLSIVPDGFKSDKFHCWRGVMEWKENDKWCMDDCGCHNLPHDARTALIKMVIDHCIDRKIDFINI